jgi:hypothetical protein
LSPELILDEPELFVSGTIRAPAAEKDGAGDAAGGAWCASCGLIETGAGAAGAGDDGFTSVDLRHMKTSPERVPGRWAGLEASSSDDEI